MNQLWLYGNFAQFLVIRLHLEKYEANFGIHQEIGWFFTTANVIFKNLICCRRKNLWNASDACVEISYSKCQFWEVWIINTTHTHILWTIERSISNDILLQILYSMSSSIWWHQEFHVAAVAGYAVHDDITRVDGVLLLNTVVRQNGFVMHMNSHYGTQRGRWAGRYEGRCGCVK